MLTTQEQSARGELQEALRQYALLTKSSLRSKLAELQAALCREQEAECDCAEQCAA